MDFTTQLLIAAISAGTPLLLATLGGILTERAGIIQLGAEGLMLMGAVTTCIVYIRSGNLILALLSAVAITALLGMGPFILMCHAEGESDDVGSGDDAVRQRS